MFFRYDQDRGDRFDGNRISNPDPSNQYRRGWQYDPEIGISLTILVEAESAEHANVEAQGLGISFEPDDISVWGFGEITKRWGTPPPKLYRWVRVASDEQGFEEEAEALGDSDHYVLFNPWEVDPEFLWWPVFVHYANGEFCGWQPHVLWRSEYDGRPVE